MESPLALFALITVYTLFSTDSFPKLQIRTATCVLGISTRMFSALNGTHPAPPRPHLILNHPPRAAPPPNGLNWTPEHLFASFLSLNPLISSVAYLQVCIRDFPQFFLESIQSSPSEWLSCPGRLSPEFLSQPPSDHLHPNSVEYTNNTEADV